LSASDNLVEGPESASREVLGRREFAFIAILIFAVGLLMRLPALHEGMQGADDMRQATTATIAKNMAAEGLRPSAVRSDIMEWGTRDFVVWKIEFPLFQAIVALLSKVAGNLESTGRLANLAFMVGACGVFLLWLRDIAGRAAALAGLAIVAFSPLCIYYSATFQRDGLMHFLLCAWLFHFTKFLDSRDWRRLGLSLACAALSLMLHPARAMVVGWFFVFATLGSVGLGAFRKAWAWLAMPAAALPLAAWLAWLRYFQGGLSSDLAGQPGMREFGKPSYWIQWWRPEMAESAWLYHVLFGASALLAPLAIPALLLPVRRKFLGIGLLVGNLAMVVFDSYPFCIVPHRYYFVDGVFCIATLVAMSVGWMLRGQSRGRSIAAAVALAACAGAYSLVCYPSVAFGSRIWWQKYPPELAGRLFRERVPSEEDRVVAFAEDGFPETAMYQFGAEGWGIPPGKDPGEAMATLRSLGCRFLGIELGPLREQASQPWLAWADEHLEPLFVTRRFAVYRVEERASPPPEVRLQRIASLPVGWVSAIRPAGGKMYFFQPGILGVLEVAAPTGPDASAEPARQIKPEKPFEGRAIDFEVGPGGEFCFLAIDPPRIVEYATPQAEPAVIPLPGDSPLNLRWWPAVGAYVVSMADSGSVLIVDRSGRVLRRFGTFGGASSDCQFNPPRKLDVWGDRLAVADFGSARVMVYDSEFRTLDERGAAPFLPIGRMNGACFLPGGGIAMASDATDNLVLTDPAGRVTVMASVPEPDEVRWDPSTGFLFVSSWGTTNEIVVYRIDDPGGVFAPKP